MYLSHLNNSELYRCYSDAEINVSFIYDKDIPEEFIDMFCDLSKYIDIAALRNDYKVYNEMLKKAIGAGFFNYIRKEISPGQYHNRELSDIEKDSIVIYMMAIDEFRKRRINPDNMSIFEKPEKISDIPSVNSLGGDGTKYALGGGGIAYFTIDYSVRHAVKILRKKGYITYWSSGNEADATRRTGTIIPNKNVAYILIDPTNFPDNNEELVRLLSLDDAKRLWG